MGTKSLILIQRGLGEDYMVWWVYCQER